MVKVHVCAVLLPKESGGLLPKFLESEWLLVEKMFFFLKHIIKKSFDFNYIKTTENEVYETKNRPIGGRFLRFFDCPIRL